MEILIIIVIIFFVFIFSLNAPAIKGAIGESRVASKLNKLNDEEFKVFNNVLLQTGSGSSQIDHVIISRYGIFVIETKSYKGWIHGNENSEYWTQSIYKKKTKFRNPIKQNWSHIYALKEILSDYNNVVYHPIVVFAGSGELKNVYSSIPVVYNQQLIPTIMNKCGIPTLSIMQVNNITDRLNEILIQDRQARKEHVHQVQNHAYEKKKKEKSSVCPRCGGNLVVRDGPYGKFYGCSNYPKCRYSLKYGAR